jgi:hypothetical protein
MLRRGIKIFTDEGGAWRFVTHYYVSEKDLRYFARELSRFLSPRRKRAV